MKTSKFTMFFVAKDTVIHFKMYLNSCIKVVGKPPFYFKARHLAIAYLAKVITAFVALNSPACPGDGGCTSYGPCEAFLRIPCRMSAFPWGEPCILKYKEQNNGMF